MITAVGTKRAPGHVPKRRGKMATSRCQLYVFDFSALSAIFAFPLSVSADCVDLTIILNS